MQGSVSYADVVAAARSLDGAVELTPARESRTLSVLTGARVFLKFENLQFTASFKERGALNRLLALSPEERKRGVVAMSAGNHAQGLAYHAGRLGIPATIVMPEGTSFTKIKHTRDFGAHVIETGASLDEAFAACSAIERGQGLILVHPYDDPLVIAGQGTVALEFLAQAPELDTLVVPVGGGGLLAGMAVAAKSVKPDCVLYGVETELYPAMRNALTGETGPCTGPSVADGIAVKRPGALTFPLIKALAREMLLVSEADIEAAMVKLLEIEKTLAEGAGAAALAAVLAFPDLFRGRNVGIVVSGGNIDLRLLSNVILRELSRQGRVISLALEIDDRPGALARVATAIGEAGGNIIEVSHNRLMTGVSAKSAELKLVVEARDAGHARAIEARLEAAGFRLRSTL